ncbi:MAG: tetratricopeptide repeat protein [Krumholzibacteria bacterium]|nr:tetratricopeptide repeat protein [Candidatus Krumholzibacteria bacterium]
MVAAKGAVDIMRTTATTTRGALVLAAVILAAALGGCREAADLTDLEQFVQRTAALDGRVLEDSLRAYLAGGPPGSTYASFMLGNRFYDAAADSAAVQGWDAAAVPALLDSAELHFSRAVAQDSSFVEALVNLGSVWDDRAEQRGPRPQRDSRLAQAERFYQLALAVDPADEKARCNLGGLYLRQRRTQEAVDQFQMVLDHDPTSALAHYNLAIMFAEQKIYREALREWELAAKHDPDGDIGERSRENVRIVKDLMSAPDPREAGR